MNWSWGQFGPRCDPYALVKSDKVDICLSEIAVIVLLFVNTVNCLGNHAVLLDYVLPKTKNSG